MQLPEEFISTSHQLFKEEAADFLNAINGVPPVSVRINPLKLKRNPLVFAPDVMDEPVPWSSFGYYLKERPAFTFDPLFHTGYYYSQEASSMFIEHVIRNLVTDKSVCLDLCGAPGGKSIAMLSALPDNSLIVCNEIMPQRAHILAENLTKYGYPNVVTTNCAPKDFSSFEHFFDVVLVDAPCSGEGMFRKDEGAISEWSVQNVNICAARQKNILNDIWPSLKPGGFLIYSTCTYNLSENEENVEWFKSQTGAVSVSVPIEDSWGILSGQSGYRFLPHRVKGEGLFVSILQKPDEDSVRNIFSKNKKKSAAIINKTADFSHLLNVSVGYECFEEKSQIFTVSSGYSEVISLLKEKLKVLTFGVKMGDIKGKDFIPAHSLAMSLLLKPDSFPMFALSYEEAIAYLRREAIFAESAPRGYLLLTYNNEPLGFVKNMINRANNLYPHEWRIRSAYIPKELLHRSMLIP